MSSKLSNPDIERLLNAALCINDHLKVVDDHVKYTGSTNDVNFFRDQVNLVWHRWCGWVPPDPSDSFVSTQRSLVLENLTTIWRRAGTASYVDLTHILDRLRAMVKSLDNLDRSS